MDNFSSNMKTIKEGIVPRNVTDKEEKTIFSSNKANEIDKKLTYLKKTKYSVYHLEES